MLSITLKQLEFFIAIVETKSFSKTADLLSFSQPAVSSSVQLLEETLQVELLDRSNKKKIEITPEGMDFYRHAKEILANCYTLQNMVNSRPDADTIAIGAHSIPARYMLTDLMAFYKSVHPETRFLLKEGTNVEVASLLDKKSIDIGIVSTSSDSEANKQLLIYNDKIVIGMPNTPKYKYMIKSGISLREILAKEMVVWNDSIADLVTSYLENQGIFKEDLNLIAEMNSEQLAKQAVIDGLGISFLSNISLKCAKKSGEVLAYELPDPPARSITLMYNPSRIMNQAGKDFIKFVGSGAFDFEKCNH